MKSFNRRLFHVQIRFSGVFQERTHAPQGDCSPRGRGRGERPFSYGGVGGCGFGTQPCLGHRRAWWGGGGRWGAVEHGTAWRRWGWCFRRGSPAGPPRALPAPASSLPPSLPATVGPPHTEPLRIQRDTLRPPSDLVRPRWPHVRPCPRRPWPPCPGSRWLCPQLRAGGSLCVPHRFVPFALVQPPAGPWGDTTDPNAPSPSASPGD